MADISFAETDFNLGRKRAEGAWKLGIADLDRQRENLSRQTTRNYENLARQYKQAAPQQITQFTGRGLGRSGLFKKSMTDFALQQERDRAEVLRNMSEQQALYDVEQAGYDQALNDEIARLEQVKLKQIAADAAALKNAAPLI